MLKMPQNRKLAALGGLQPEKAVSLHTKLDYLQLKNSN